MYSKPDRSRELEAPYRSRPWIQPVFRLLARLKFVRGTPLDVFGYTGDLQVPDSNRLYVVFVQDNVAVQRSDGSNSLVSFQGYHSAFQFASFVYPDYYVVIPYSRGSVGNAAASWLSDFNNLTLITSREVANAVTNPYVSGFYPGFVDDSLNLIVGQRAV